jgi:hypothetical protein
MPPALGVRVGGKTEAPRHLGRSAAGPANKKGRTAMSINSFPQKSTEQPGKIIDLTGEKFGRLTVLAWHPSGIWRSRSQPMWLCRCRCGIERVVLGHHLRAGKTRSCGCFARERSTTHGLSRTHVYRVWQGMKERCLNRRHRSYFNYGGRGIKVCERWLIFENFYADMGDPPPGLSLDRINNNGNYEPNNCRWATQAQQLANRRPPQRPKRRRRSSSAALHRYVAATQRVPSEAAQQ